MEKTPTIIDLTPLWVGILPALLAALEGGTEEGKRMAREELKHMAQVADLAKEASEQRDGLRAALLKISSECRGEYLGSFQSPTSSTMGEIAMLLNRIKGAQS